MFAPRCWGRGVTFRGHLEEVLYSRGGFFVARAQEEGGARVSLAGKCPFDVFPGQTVHAVGRWEEHPKYGKQIQVTSLDPGYQKAVAANSSLEEIVGSRALALKIRKAWDSEETAVATVWKNPFLLATTVRGIGFRTADTIARRINFIDRGNLRLRCAVQYTLFEAAGNGHTYLEMGKLRADVMSLLRMDAVQSMEVDAVIQGLIADGLLHRTTFSKGQEPAVFSRPLWECEKKVALLLLKLKERTIKGGIIPSEIADALQRDRVALTGEQMKVLCGILQDAAGISCLASGPGCGKSFLVAALRRVWTHVMKEEPLLVSPSGRGAARLKEMCGEGVNAQTIHRALGYNPHDGSFARCKENTLHERLVILDETSMVDIRLIKALLSALHPRSRILFVGDPDQLPSVGAGNVLQDIVTAEAVPLFRLHQVHRQRAESDIVQNAYRINAGKYPLLQQASLSCRSDAMLVPLFQEKDLGERNTALQWIVQKLIPSLGLPNLDMKRDVQFLTPMRKGMYGSMDLNEALAGLLNPDRKAQGPFAVGDRVMQTGNNYDTNVFNGDIGIVERVFSGEDTDLGRTDPALVVRFPDKEPVSYTKTQRQQELIPAWAVTIHKSQGSEFRVVVVPVLRQHYRMLSRKLLYTAVSRASTVLIVMGTAQSLHMAIRENAMDERNSGLRHLLAQTPAVAKSHLSFDELMDMDESSFLR